MQRWWFAVSAVVVLGARGALGATFTVNSTADAVDATIDGICAAASGACTLRAAVQEANAAADADVVVLPAGTFRLAVTGTGEDAAATGDLDVTQPLEIDGAGADATIVDGLGLDRVLQVLGSATLVLKSLTITNGDAQGGPGGGVCVSGTGALTLDTVTFTLGHAASGGGVFAGGPVSVRGSIFEGNFAGTGGGLFVSGADAVAIESSRFTSNSATGTAGGLFVSNGADVALTDCTVADNFAAGSGAGAFVNTAGSLAVTGGTFTNNFGTATGGGLFFYGGGSSALTIQGAAFRANRGIGSGGGIFATLGGAATFTDVEVSGSVGVGSGGGVFLSGESSLAMTRCRILDNANLGGSGGGVFDAGNGGATVVDSTFDGNFSYIGPGGGLYRSGPMPLAVESSTFSRNVVQAASGIGGGIFLSTGGTSTIVNSTISGNVAGSQGGGVFAGSDVTATNVTFAANQAGTAGAAVFNPGVAVTLTNSILAASVAHSNCGGTVTSGGGNVDDDGSCALAGPGDRQVDPKLGALADNGGPTLTHALAADSPAIDTARAGACPAADQRGIQRLNDGNGDGTAGCDVGAYEFVDECPADPAKVLPGICGCGVADTDANANGVADCLVNPELKARLSAVGTALGALTGQKNPTQTALRTELDGLTAGIVDYVKRLHGQIHTTNPKAKLVRLAKRLKAAARTAGRARGHGLKGARKRALAALQALDAVVAAE